MDTDTILKIIKMLDIQISNHWEDAQACCKGPEPSRDELPDYQYDFGGASALELFRDHLQSFIEDQLNGLENQTVE